MNFGKHSRQIFALAMAISMALAAAMPVRAIGDGVTPTYDEAYYATLDYYGNLTEGSVVKSYIMNGATSISDYGTYDTVTNLSNGIRPTSAGGKTTFAFDAAGAPSHFYFQGNTAEPFENLPWTLSLSYRLNGVAARAETLAGQKGVVEIDIDAIPNPRANDYTKNNYTLEAMALFNQDDILSLEAPGAQVQLVGNLRAVLFIALPGEEDHFAIRVGTEDFSFDGMTFLMVPATLSQLEEISKLGERKDDLEENYNELAGSLDELLDSLDDVSSSLVAAAAGLDALNAARGTVSAGKGNVYDKADTLRADLDLINEALDPIAGDLENASEGLTDTKEALGALNTGVAGLREELDALEGILDDLRKSNGDLTAVVDDMAGLEQKLEALRGSRQALYNVLNDLSGMEYEFDDIYEAILDNNVQLRTIGKVSASSGGNSKLDQAAEVYSAYTGFIGGDSQDFTAFAKKLISIAKAAGKASEVAELELGLDAAAAAAAGDITQSKIYQSAIAQGATAEAASAAAASAAATAASTATALTGGLPAALSANMSFGDFLKDIIYVMYASNMDYSDIQTLLNVYEDNDGSVEAVLASAGDISSSIDSSIDDINDEIDKANKTITSVSGLLDRLREPTLDLLSSLRALSGDVDALKKLVDSSDALVASLAELCRDAGNLRPLLDSADDLAALGQTTAEKLSAVLEEVDALYGVLDEYEPKAQEALETVDGIIGVSRQTVTDTSAFAEALEDLMKSSGTQLDAGTRQSLGSLAASLRNIAATLDKTDGIREAKDTVEGIIEDTWDDYTGDINNLLLMDADAEPVSLTDPRNAPPTSVQIMIRTQEIKEDDGGGLKVTNLAAPAAEKTTFWQRIGQMFKDIWTAIIGLIHL